jgi:hypothetical protein
MLSVSHIAQYQMTDLLVTVSELKAKTLGHEAEVLKPLNCHAQEDASCSEL